MPQVPPQQRLYFELSPEKEREIFDRTLREQLERANEDIQHSFPEGLPMMQRPKNSEELLARYNAVTDPADLDIMGQDDFVERFRAGEVAPPMSPFWRQLLFFPDVFNQERRKFNSLLKRDE